MVKDAAVVERTDPSGHRGVVRAVSGFVAEGPPENTGVVLVPQHHALRAVREGGGPRGIVGEVEIVGVTLQVRFVEHVEAVFVAEVEELGGRRIMAAPDRVHVETLHRLDIFPHVPDRERTPAGIAVLVPVDAADQYRLSVDQHAAVPDFHRAEADARGGRIQLHPVPDQGHGQGVKIRVLGVPGADGRNPERGVRRAPCGVLRQRTALRMNERAVPRTGADHPAFRIVKADSERVPGEIVRPFGKAEHGFKLQNAVLPLVFKRGLRKEIGDRTGGFGEQLNAPDEPRVPPFVLVLEIGRIRPLDDDDREFIFTGFQEFRDIEFRCAAGVLRESGGNSVHEGVENAFRAVETEQNAASLPVGRNPEKGAVDAGRIAFRRGGRGLLPGHGRVGVVRIVVSLHVPASRNGDFFPWEFVRGEVVRHGQRVLEVKEIPVAVEGEGELAAAERPGRLPGFIFGSKMKKRRARRLPFEADRLRTVPGQFFQFDSHTNDLQDNGLHRSSGIRGKNAPPRV
ncbi:MAG: hypothetical protein BWY31_04271 [Lentisphaerae bacterium ADurb.Bin242]|nr:MAG: hypothetical protein BWY31_04271 [Lentisphaerae bacterium ADurb.Bin242]